MGKCWHYGEGFPKSLNLSLAIDKSKGFARPPNNYQPITEEAKRWAGWGTTLKPATEFWTLARKSLSADTIAENIVHFGTGGIHVDECRLEPPAAIGGAHTLKTLNPGRFPANLILDEYMAGVLDGQSGVLTSGKPSGVRKARNNVYGQYAPGQAVSGYGDSGGASRFFYVAKASVAERGKGNRHPTVKPITLMHYLIRLIYPLEPGRIVLEPFAGSGSTCIAAKRLGLNFYAFEKVAEYVEIAER